MKCLSVAIAAKNESEAIQRCIRSAAFADEIVVVDDCSEDDTVERARSLGAHVAIRESQGSFHENKNAAIQIARGDWILSLDADEVVSKPLARSIKTVLENPENDGYLLDRHNYFASKWIRGCGWYPDHLLRLFKKGAAWWPPQIHDVPRLTSGNDNITLLDGPLFHYSYRNLEQYFDKFNRYTSRLAVEYSRKQIKTAGLYSGVNLCIKPLYWFTKKYVYQRGYRDGWLGLFICVSSALTIFVSHLKLMEDQGK